MGWNQRRETKDDFNFRLRKLKFDMNYSTGKKFRSKVCSIWSRLYLRHMRHLSTKSRKKDKYANLDLFACVYFNVMRLKGFSHGSAGKDSACSVGDLGLIPGLGRYLGEGNSYPLQYSGVVNSMDCIVDGVTKSQTQLSDFHTYTHMWLNALT